MARWRTLFFCAGIVMLMAGLVCGKLQYRQYQIVVLEDAAASRLVADNGGNLYLLPFAIRLEQLNFEVYPSGNVKNAAAVLSLAGRDKTESKCVSVNHPVHYRQYDLYLAGYWRQTTAKPAGIKMMLVKQPVQWAVYGGITLLVLVAIWWASVAIRNFWERAAARQRILKGILFVLTLATFVLASPVLRQKELPPVLQSVCFLPHVIAYVLSYALFLAAVLTGASGRKNGGFWRQSVLLFQAGTACYTIGLCLGMVWAKAAWGDFWGWDPKETAAAVTWLLCLATSRIEAKEKCSFAMWMALQSLCIVSLFICWFGLRLLRLGGLHLY